MEPDADGPELQHALCAIPEFGYRVLCVVFNEMRNLPHVVTVYFDRTMNGIL